MVVEFGDRIDRVLNDRVLRLSAAVRAANLPGVVETVPTFRSLMVHYDPLATDNASLIAAIENLLNRLLDGTLERSAGIVSAVRDSVEQIPQLVEQLGGKVVGLGFLVELTFLGGREKLAGYDVFSLLQYDK